MPSLLKKGFHQYFFNTLMYSLILWSIEKNKNYSTFFKTPFSLTRQGNNSQIHNDFFIFLYQCICSSVIGEKYSKIRKFSFAVSSRSRFTQVNILFVEEGRTGKREASTSFVLLNRIVELKEVNVKSNECCPKQLCPFNRE